ncbi:MAG: phosphate transport system regulatory protein PhoU [Anaerolinea sp.]|nr:phosphate transport system regulatory protein PhoU [Anaerolinea sp.]
MPRETMDREIRELKDEILMLGSMVEKNISDAMVSLKTRNVQLSLEVLQADNNVNQKRFDIESAALLVIATQQPMAHDLRLLAAILEVAGELERIGDYAKGNAKINTLLEYAVHEVPLLELEAMSEAAASMLHRAVIAFVKEDEKEARDIPLEDDRVDEMYKSIYRKLVECMIQKPQTIDHTNFYMWAAHNLERTADRVSNICERTIFVVTGELTELTHNDEDMS